MKKGRTPLYACLPVLLLGMFLCSAVVAAEDDKPGQVITDLHEALVDVMQKSHALGYEGRYDRLEPIITRGFDTPFIAKTILSRHWKQLDEASKAEFIALFNRLSIATYASRFSAYDGEDFREVSQKPLRKGRLLVKTELLRAGQEKLSLDYILHEKDGAWHIIGVIADGVNDLSLKRAEYASVIKEKGYNGLIQDISAKIRDMEGND